MIASRARFVMMQAQLANSPDLLVISQSSNTRPYHINFLSIVYIVISYMTLM